MTDKEQIKEIAKDIPYELDDLLKTISFFYKISFEDTGEPILERCINKENDAVGFYNYKTKCFWYLDLDSNKLVKDKPKNYLTQGIMEKYGYKIKRDEKNDR